MTRLASLPMYDADRPAVDRLWQGIAHRLRRDGVRQVPDSLVWPEDALDAHWLHPRLLLSQACGYPAALRLRDKVRLVGAFRYTADGCDGIHYRSLLVAREDDPGERIDDFRGRAAAYNAADSHSGCNALLALVAPLAEAGRFFGRAVASGSHARSMKLVKDGAADIAAIDCITHASLARARPEALRGLRVVGTTGAAPGLPLITAVDTSVDDLAALRRAVAGVFDDPALAAVRGALFLGGFEVVPATTYDCIAELRAQTLALGCTALG